MFFMSEIVEMSAIITNFGLTLSKGPNLQSVKCGIALNPKNWFLGRKGRTIESNLQIQIYSVFNSLFVFFFDEKAVKHPV